MELNITYIDSGHSFRSLYLFEFSFVGISDFTSENHTTHTSRLEEFIERHSKAILLAPNILLLLTLENEGKFMKSIRDYASGYNVENFSITCIEKGFFASTWIKKL